MACALVALGRKPGYEEINRYESDVEPLLIDYFELRFEREPVAAGWRQELQSMAIDKKSLDKVLQSRGVRAVSPIEYATRKKLCDPIAHALASTLNYEKGHLEQWHCRREAEDAAPGTARRQMHAAEVGLTSANRCGRSRLRAILSSLTSTP